MQGRSLRFLACVLIVIVASIGALAAGAEYQVFVGTYTNGNSKGIYTFRFDTVSGKVTSPQLAAETENPSFLTVDANAQYLYAVNEIGNYKGTHSGAVSAFSIDPATAKLKLQQQVSSLGGSPAHVTLDNTGSYLLVANYSGGNVAVFPIGKDGRLGEHTALDQHTGSSVNPQRQKGPHAHSIQMTVDNRFALSADLGLDKIMIRRFGAADGTLTANDPEFATVAPGSGPRHLAFAPSGKFVYVINEMANTVSVFSYEASTAAMHEVQSISTITDAKPSDSGAEIVLDRKGRFLYTSARGSDVIAQFAVDRKSGKLTLVGRTSTEGKTPRFFTLDPTGTWMFVANQNSNDIVVFKIDAHSGRLTRTGTRIEVGSPVCVVFVPASTN